jgi:hypothetical protein
VAFHVSTIEALTLTALVLHANSMLWYVKAMATKIPEPVLKFWYLSSTPVHVYEPLLDGVLLAVGI